GVGGRGHQARRGRAARGVADSGGAGGVLRAATAPVDGAALCRADRRAAADTDRQGGQVPAAGGRAHPGHLGSRGSAAGGGGIVNWADTPQEAAFREEVRAFVADRFPADYPPDPTAEHSLEPEDVWGYNW